ncbi:hypothetical protein KU306_12185 [Haloferax larsenii]|uniref:Transcriptional regulator n=1 Tax=Haloferax larsenii TaxID=302484 RepID=A0ABY5RCT2_HALLR|nr:hypothetical protein [Haloferax larsenii]UVE49663.1 hypothetical protein KU306_12185 [Haloferax larsenii]
MTELKWQIDHDDARFIDAVRYYGGEAAMHEIRGRTGLSRGKANHRFDKMEDLGLIDVTKQPYKSGEEKVAHLTGKARREIERGLLNDLQRGMDAGDVDDLISEVRGLRDDLQRVETKVDVLNEAIRDLDDDVEWLDEYVVEWTDEAEGQIIAIRDALDAEFDVDALEYRD